MSAGARSTNAWPAHYPSVSPARPEQPGVDAPLAGPLAQLQRRELRLLDGPLDPVLIAPVQFLPRVVERGDRVRVPYGVALVSAADRLAQQVVEQCRAGCR